MSWQNEMVIIVRHMVNDLNSASYEFSNSRLEEAILVSAQNLKGELEFYHTYNIEVDNRLLTPDPTTTPTNISNKDDDFIALCCLKTSILITHGQWRYYSLRAISTKDGPTSLDMKGIAQAFKNIHDDLIKQFEQAKFDYQCSAGGGKAILSPYSPASYTWSDASIDRRSGNF